MLDIRRRQFAVGQIIAKMEVNLLLRVNLSLRHSPVFGRGPL
jgi:hypothetical protein